MLTAAAAMQDQVDGLTLAPTTTAKPFDFPVLVVGIGALMRRP